MRLMGARQHRCGADKAKVPTQPQQDQCNKEVSKINTLQGNNTRRRKDQQPQAHDPFHPKARDQMAGEEARREHRVTTWPAEISENPQPTTASGVDVITRFINA